MARIAQFAVAFLLVTGVPAAHAGLLEFLATLGRDANEAATVAKAAKDAEVAVKAADDTEKTEQGISAEANAVKAETQVGVVNAPLVSAEANALKVENKVGGDIGGGGGSSGGDDHWLWLYALVLLAFIAVGGWILSKPRSKYTPWGGLRVDSRLPSCIGGWDVLLRLDDGSRMSRDAHVRFCKRRG
jgi:hypothetical protein